MRRVSGLLLVVLFVGMGACTTSNEKVTREEDMPPEERERRNAFDEAREIHDEMMPYIDSIFESRGIINEELERAAEGLKEVREERKRALEEVVKELDDARQSMMNWMRNDSAMPVDTLSHEEVMRQLEKSLENIEATREKMLRSLEKARGVIGDTLQ